jgi:hypothetical protein
MTLKRIAAQRNISIAELMRHRLLYPNLWGHKPRGKTAKFHSSKTDLSEKHNAYLSEVYGR